MQTIFDLNFYIKFTPPNSKELIKLLDGIKTPESNEKFTWDVKCLVDTIPLESKNWADSLIPSLNIFSEHFSYTDNFEVSNPWINHYSYNGFQETHYHPYSDISAVFFINEGIDFGRFYFYDRMSGLINPKIQKLLRFDDTCVPKVNCGDMIMFPSYLLHGVTPHKNEEIRKTLSFNIKLI